MDVGADHELEIEWRPDEQSERSAPTRYEIEGRRLAEVVRLLLKYSNTGIAESLLKALGAARDGSQGSWGSGTASPRS